VRKQAIREAGKNSVACNIRIYHEEAVRGHAGLDGFFQATYWLFSFSGIA
jgi:hypothetical protein